MKALLYLVILIFAFACTPPPGRPAGNQQIKFLTADLQAQDIQIVADEDQIDQPSQPPGGVVAYIETHWELIASLLFLILSEFLGSNPKMKSNGILNLIYNLLKKSATKVKT